MDLYMGVFLPDSVSCAGQKKVLPLSPNSNNADCAVAKY